MDNIMDFEINLHLLRADIRALSEQIRALKRELRARWVRPMADSQRALQRLKLRATELCALRAFSRGKLHVRQAPHGAHCTCDARVFHQRLAERLGPSYARVLEQSA
jgi:hypothetical protein